MRISCIEYRGHTWIFLLALLVVLPTSVVSARPPTNHAAIYRQPAVCKFRSEEAMAGMAVLLGDSDARVILIFPHLQAFPRPIEGSPP